MLSLLSTLALLGAADPNSASPPSPPPPLIIIAQTQVDPSAVVAGVPRSLAVEELDALHGRQGAPSVLIASDQLLQATNSGNSVNANMVTTGALRIDGAYSVFECGHALVPEIVAGQAHGGFAMGVGYALLEDLPPYEDGPGNGTWNFDRYHLPRAHDVAVWSQTGDILPPISDTDPPKGIAEVVMIPIVAAIVNGIAHAIGHRFTDLPVTPEKIREVLES